MSPPGAALGLAGRCRGASVPGLAPAEPGASPGTHKGGPMYLLLPGRTPAHGFL